MNRPLLIAAFGFLLASAPLVAQHGGGHASAGGHGGMAAHGSFGGNVGGGHAFSGMRSGPAIAPRSFSRGSTFRPPISSRFGNRSGVGLRLRTRSFNRCYGYGCGWAYPYPYLGGGIDPYWWWDNDSSYGNDPYYNQDPPYDTGLANQMREQGIAQAPTRGQEDPDLYARSTPPAQQSHEERTEAAPATVLVFRDQHRQEVQNYAIVGQTLWSFDPQHKQKIPLSDLDLPATTKANDERGVDFRLPGSHEGQ